MIHILSSFILAGLWIAGATLLAERLGSRLGGLIANLPSNIVISYIFIALSGDIGYAASATSAVPVGMLIDTIFLLVLILALGRGIVMAVLLSLASWLGLAWLAASVSVSTVWITVVLSHFLPSYWVGLVSTFPAVLLSSMVILTIAQGPAFARATGKVLVLSSTNIVVYALVIRWAYPVWGVWWGTLAGFAAAVVYVAGMRPLLERISR